MITCHMSHYLTCSFLHVLFLPSRMKTPLTPDPVGLYCSLLQSLGSAWSLVVLNKYQLNE